MKDFLLIEGTNNLAITGFDFSFTNSNSEYVAQKLRIRLSFFLGEWYLNTNKGLPYFQEIFKKNPNLNLIEDVFKTEIISIDYVEEIVSFDIQADVGTRKLTINFVVKLTDGSLVSVTI